MGLILGILKGIFGFSLIMAVAFFAYYGMATFWGIIGRITKPLTPLFDYYTKLKIRDYTLFLIVEGFTAYIIVMIPFILFALLGAYIVDFFLNLFDFDLFS